MKLKVGDNVVIKTGKDKGKTGKILKIDREKTRVQVEKINLQTKFSKKTANAPGQKIQKEGFIHASNVMVLCPKTNKPTRVGKRVLKDGTRERFAKVSGETLS
jgi:large subunit ribosomal protein L24